MALTTTPTVVFFVATACVLAGCSGSNTSANDACTLLAQAQCGRRQVCADLAAGGNASHSDGVYILKNFGDLATCLQQQKLSCLDGLVAPGTGTTPTLVEKCTAEYATWTCADLYDNGANPPPDCAIPGQLANGAVCTFNGQCSSRFCAGTKNAARGVCADEPLEGASCATSGCAPGQACKTEPNGDQLCRTRLAVAASCTSDTVCAAFTSCLGDSGSDPSKTGTCTATATTVGAPCGGTNPACEGNLGLTCLGSGGARTCQAIAYVRAPSACGTLSDGSRADCIAGDCFTATGPAALTATNATCIAKALEGAACDTQTGPLCLSPARCVTAGNGTTNGTCLVPKG
jgi:hypothetical protein